MSVQDVPRPASIPLQPAAAGFWQRASAIVLDSLILGLIGIAIGFAIFDWAARHENAAKLVGFAIAFFYFGILNSRLGGGRTLGKRLLGIRVVDQSGNGLSPTRSALRFLVIGIPYFLPTDPGAGLSDWQDFLLSTIANLVVVGGLCSAVYLLIFNTPSRQALHDLLARSYVLRNSSVAPPVRATTRRVHLIVVGALLLIGAATPSAILWGADKFGILPVIKSSYELQTALQKELGNSSFVVSTRISGISALQVDMPIMSKNADITALQATLAASVLKLQPNLLGMQVLAVQVHRGFDLGIARWQTTYREDHSAYDWQRKLK